MTMRIRHVHIRNVHIRSTLGLRAALFALAVVVSACGGTGGDDAAGGDASIDDAESATTVSDASGADETDGDETVETDATTTTTTAPIVVDNPLVEITVAATESGPRPLLAWDAIDGAVDYRVVVLDAQGQPYWAWSGPETEINVGGVSNPDAAGATVFEPMTWTVAAIDADGVPVAMSAAGALTP